MDTTCTNCSASPIVGARYKCSRAGCEINLCELCEIKSTHEHHFIKIKDPAQYSSAELERIVELPSLPFDRAEFFSTKSEEQISFESMPSESGLVYQKFESEEKHFTLPSFQRSCSQHLDKSEDLVHLQLPESLCAGSS